MGLLDGLFSGGGGGGLLDFLRQNAMNQQMQPGGLSSDQAQYGQRPMQANAQMLPQSNFGLNQPSPLDNAQWPAGPIGAPSMAQASGSQPVQPSPIQAAPAQQPASPPLFGGQSQGTGSNFMAGLANLNSGGNPITMIANMADGFSTGRRHDRTGIALQQQALVQQRENQTAKYLETKLGIDPAMAASMASDPATLRALWERQSGGGGLTDDIKEYQFAKKEDPSLTFNKFMSQKKAVSGEYSLTPQYGTNDKGETVLIQTGKSGEAIQTKLPANVKISSGVDKIDLGTSWGIVDKRTGQMVGQQPKDVAGRESAEKIGQARGVAQAALNNGADIDAEETKKKIDQFINSKGFNEVFGQIDQYRPKWSHSDAGTDALARYEQLTGVAFLSAYQMLKGGGAITDIEGQKAGAAMARLNRAQSEAEAKAALNDFKDAVDTGLRKLKRAANGGVDTAPSTAPPPAGGGSVDALLKKYGG